MSNKRKRCALLLYSYFVGKAIEFVQRYCGSEGDTVVSNCISKKNRYKLGSWVVSCTPFNGHEFLS